MGIHFNNLEICIYNIKEVTRFLVLYRLFWSLTDIDNFVTIAVTITVTIHLKLVLYILFWSLTDIDNFVTIAVTIHLKISFGLPYYRLYPPLINLTHISIKCILCSYKINMVQYICVLSPRCKHFLSI